MIVSREKMIFYFKALLCISFISLWSFWFTNSSKEIRQKKILKHSSHIQTKKTIHKNISNTITEKKKSVVNSKIQDLKDSKERASLQNKLVKELPKLVNLTPVKTNIEKNPSKVKVESNISKEMINLNLPQIASATRKVLLNDSKKNQEVTPGEHNPALRKVVPVEKDKLKPVLINLKENKNQNIEQEIYLDKIAEQIELSGIVHNPNSESTAIIRDRTNNYIEILKKGSKYKGLKLLEINKSEIVLLDEALNKTYIKKINTGE